MKPCIETIDFHGIEALRLHGPKDTSAVISKLGGQVLSWKTSDQRERLFLSEKAVFDGSVAMRGGIPVCFPQFASQGDLPKHGLLRTKQWRLETERTGDDFALVTLAINDDEQTRALWPHPFLAELTLMIEADRIDVELSITNTGGAPFEFTGALHTYIRLVQVEDAAIEGLRGHEYRDAANGNEHRYDSGTELVVEGEVDRVYFDVKRPQHLKAGNHSLGIQGQGFPDVVIWNPWVDLCADLKDMPADGWRHMLCVEAAAVREPVVLPAGEEWYGRQTLVAV
ncbi:MAG: Aldose 1-epimerase [Proteobacteria bacterium]|nr:Aldose 1-epimerase [Pseudomonadota bacterium]